MRAASDLSGTWRAAVADDELRRAYVAADFDDAGWVDVPVPGHWQRTPELAGTDGPVLYRRPTETASLGEGERAWLTLQGAFSQADVWFDGTYLGDADGYFASHSFEITGEVRARRDHCVAVEVAHGPRALAGTFHGTGTNPGGLWRAVLVETSGPVRILRHRVTVRDVDAVNARIEVRSVLHTGADRDVALRTTVAGSEHRSEHHLAAGENRLEWQVTLPAPALWWPRSLGGQPLHDVVVDVLGTDGAVSDSRTRRVGFRTVRMDDFVVRVNGERIFLKGANLDPLSRWPAELATADIRHALQFALDGGLDLLRLRGHVAPPELYAMADETGLLLWQDLPLSGRQHRSVRRHAVRQARDAVDLLGHHPSVAVWCGHDEPVRWIDERRGLTFRRLLAQELPSYNRAVLDRSVGRALRSADPSRPVVTHSGAPPTLPRLSGTDSHLFPGWYTGDLDSWRWIAAAVPRLLRFVSEFGAPSVPPHEPRAERVWPELDAAALGLPPADVAALERHVPHAAHPTYASWADATRAYQAEVVRRSIESLRLLKYRPTGGFAVLRLLDREATDGWGLVDADGKAKPAYQALVDGCAPVVAVASLPSTIAGGEPVEVPLHVVSDLRSPIEVQVIATMTWPAGASVRHGWSGVVEPDGLAGVATMRLRAPGHAGIAVLDVQVRGGAVSAAGTWRTVVVEGAR